MSSPSASGGPPPPTNAKKRRKSSSKRSRLRNATFILPGTGERVRRQVTLRNTFFDGPTPSRVDSCSSSEEDPLLPLSHCRPQTNTGALFTAITNARAKAGKSWDWMKSPTGRGILKCSFAYLLGSMATFVPQISRVLGKQDGKHMVATITVYFHPARSAGSMEEAAMLGIGAFIYATFVSVSSMAVSVLCESQLDMIELGYVIVLVVFCGGGLGLVGWFKQRFNAPLVNVACSLTSLAIITVLTKENAVQTGVFSNDKINQVMKMICMGMFATTAVCLLVWPVSARKELRETMIKATDGFGDMLTTITRSFLSGTESDLKSSAFEDTANRYKTVFIQLTKTLKEAKMEHYFLGTEDEYVLEKELVSCMQRLAQAVGGLRSAAATQFTLLKEGTQPGTLPPKPHTQYLAPHVHGPQSTLKGHKDRFAVLSAIDEAPEEESDEDDHHDTLDMHRRSNDNMNSGLPSVRTPSEIFARFIMHLGPSMKSLAYTLDKILQELPFGSGPNYKITINERFTTSLADALALYKGARAEALKQLYKSKELNKERSESIEADFEEVAASCGHFSFSLQDFAEEMQTCLAILCDLKEEVEKEDRRSWKWILFWRREKRPSRGQFDPERETLMTRNYEQQNPKELPEVLEIRGDERCRHTMKKTFKTHLLRVVRFLHRDDIKFALKVGIGAALWAMVAFIPQTRPFYSRWRGEWGLLSYMLVCSMTIGASNTTGLARFLGTVLGAVIACIAWVICSGNPFALAFSGWLVSLGCFYMIIAQGKGPMGRFILLTYNLSALYAYSLSIKEGEDDDDEGGKNPIITEIALHRTVAVFGGVLWGLFITRVIWPISAREKFKDGLSILWLRMGLIWKRDPLRALLEGHGNNHYMDLREEFALQRYVTRLDALRSQAANEFELRGPFPSGAYQRVLGATTRCLDAFHAMNVVITKDLKASEGEAAILKFTAEEREQLSARISHLFQVLASSMRLEYPINDAIPNIYNARDRLLTKIFQYRRMEALKHGTTSVTTSAATSVLSQSNSEVNLLDIRDMVAEPTTIDTSELSAKVFNELGLDGTRGNKDNTHGEVITTDEDYALLYAYALVTGQLGLEIETLGKEIEGLFGVLDEDLLQLR